MKIIDDFITEKLLKVVVYLVISDPLKLPNSLKFEINFQAKCLNGFTESLVFK